MSKQPLAEHLVAKVVLLLISLRDESDVVESCVAELKLDAVTTGRLIKEARRRITLAVDYHRDVEIGKSLLRRDHLYELAATANDYARAGIIENDRCKLLDLYPTKTESPAEDHDASEDSTALAEIRQHLEPLGLGDDKTPTTELARRAVDRLIHMSPPA